MPKLTVTSRGQVTLRKSVLRHLGIRPGDRIALELLPDGRASLQAEQRDGAISAFVGSLAGKSRKVATLDEIENAAAEGWACRK